MKYFLAIINYDNGYAPNTVHESKKIPCSSEEIPTNKEIEEHLHHRVTLDSFDRVITKISTSEITEEQFLSYPFTERYLFG